MSGNNSGNVDLLKRIKELELENKQLTEQKVSSIKYKEVRISNLTVKANNATVFDIGNPQADEGYELINSYPVGVSTSERKIIYTRSYRADGKSFVVLFNPTDSDISVTTLLVYYLQYKK